MRGCAVAGVVAVLLIGASTAHAGTLTIVGGPLQQQRASLRFDAASGETNRVSVTEEAQTNIVHVRDDGAPLTIATAVGGSVVCTAVDAHEAQCVDALGLVGGPPRVELFLGDRDDSATIDPSANATLATVHGGDGNDTLNGGYQVFGDAGDDTFTGFGEMFGGDGNDTFNVPQGANIDGGPGDDTAHFGSTAPQSYGGTVQFSGGPGTDRLVSEDRRGTIDFRGGPGPDTVVPGEGDFVIWDYSHDGRTSGVKVTQDGVADDGAPGEGDNVPPAWGDVIGTDYADDISESPLGGSITGLGGDDTLHALYGSAYTWFGGNDGNDTIFARDGGRDSTYCAAGVDVAIVDAVDTADSSCETRKVG